MRCFPVCSHSGHVDKQFCGKPVIVSLKMTAPIVSTLKLKPRDLHVMANFTPLEELRESAPDVINIDSNDVKGQSFFTGKVVRLTAEYSEGESRVYECTVEFNSECRGWHYAWNGSRFKTRVEHVLAVHVYTPVIVTSSSYSAPHFSTSTYGRMASFSSVSFQIASLRRKGAPELPAQFTVEDSVHSSPKSFLGRSYSSEELSVSSDSSVSAALPPKKRANPSSERTTLAKRSCPVMPTSYSSFSKVSLGQIVFVRLNNGSVREGSAIVISQQTEGGSVLLKYLDSLELDTVPVSRIVTNIHSPASPFSRPTPLYHADPMISFQTQIL